MNIDRADNGIVIEYLQKRKDSEYSPYETKTLFFTDWEQLIDWLNKNEQYV